MSENGNYCWPVLVQSKLFQVNSRLTIFDSSFVLMEILKLNPVPFSGENGKDRKENKACQSDINLQKCFLLDDSVQNVKRNS